MRTTASSLMVTLLLLICNIQSFAAHNILVNSDSLYQTIDSSANQSTVNFLENRARLRNVMPDSSMIVLFSAPLKSKSNDIDYKYHQDPDFYYFTGINAPNAMLIVFKHEEKFGALHANEILFIEEKKDEKLDWTPNLISSLTASQISGISCVLPNTLFKSTEFDYAKLYKVFCNEFQHIDRDNKEDAGDLMSLTNHFASKMNRAGKQIYVNEAEEIFALLRQTKSAQEIELIKEAVEITCKAQFEAIKAIKPGLKEYQIEALISYTFRNNGADGEAFPSIVASGENGATMHYNVNNATLEDGQMVIMDIGAQFKNYCADVTRTVPVNGKFNLEQASIYQLVLDAQSAAISAALAGNKFWAPHDEAYRIIGKGLIKLGIISEWADISTYFIHGTSHYLGLDVHDAGVYKALSEGDIITVEPGIYIPQNAPCDKKWWGIYVRIEDDLLITNGLPNVLSECVPKKIDEIESLMKH